MSTKSSAMVVHNDPSNGNASSMELKNMLEVCGTASLLAMQNLKIIGDPGSGKTSILHFMARQVFGQYEEGGHYKKIECTPSLRPEMIVGYPNPLWSLTPESKRGGIEKWVFDGTPRDPNVWHVVLNELPRIGDMARDSLLPIMDVELNVYHPVTFWADGNTLMSAPSAAALNDRFAINPFYMAPIVDLKGVMKHGKPSTWDYNIPTWDEIVEVRNNLLQWWQHGDNTQAYVVIQNAIDTVMEVLPGTEFVVNNRRLGQWVSILYSMGMYAAGKYDFNALPVNAFEALSYCYPFENQSQALKWKAIVMKSVDPLGTKIAEFEANAFAHWNAKYEEIKSIRNGQERQQALEREIGALLASYQKTLIQEYKNDPRAKAAVNRLTSAYQQMLRGTWKG